MSALVLWEDPRTIHVDVPGVQDCEVATECYLPARAVVFFMPTPTRLENRLVCYRHAEQCKRIGRCLIFPADAAPHPDVVARRVEQELQRRQQAVYRPTGAFYGNVTMTGTTSGTVRFNF